SITYTLKSTTFEPGRPRLEGWSMAAKNWNQGRFPSLHHRKEGWLRHQENVAQQPKPTQPGWFSFCFQSENHPVRANAEASRYFLDRTATPPCGDARRGVSLDSNSFTPS